MKCVKTAQQKGLRKEYKEVLMMSKQVMAKENSSKPLWHFCSYNTFVKILQTGKIFLSDITKSNDEFELKLCRAIAQEVSKEIDNIISECGFEKFKYDYSLLLLENSIREACAPNLAWVFCLSRKMNKLWHWVEYADNLSGIAFEFDYHKILLYIRYLNSITETVRFKGLNVKYLSELPEFEVKKVKEELKMKYKQMSSQEILNFIIRFSIKYKLDFFKNENEFRIIAVNEVDEKYKRKYKDNKSLRAIGNHILYDKDGKATEEPCKTTPIDFKCMVRNEDIISHIECPINLKDMINKVWYYGGHNDGSEIKQLVDIYIPNNNISVLPFESTYER